MVHDRERLSNAIVLTIKKIPPKYRGDAINTLIYRHQKATGNTPAAYLI
jgi:hypothetical protein